MKLKQVEKCWLVALYSDGYRYLARDGFGDIYAYEQKPIKDAGEWLSNKRIWGLKNTLFRFIRDLDDGVFEITFTNIGLNDINLMRCEE